MHDDQNDDLLDRADGVPSFLTAGDPLNKRYADWIVEDELCSFKVNSMFPSDGCVLASSHSNRICSYIIVHTRLWPPIPAYRTFSSQSQARVCVATGKRLKSRGVASSTFAFPSARRLTFSTGA